jgi:glutamine synthetase
MIRDAQALSIDHILHELGNTDADRVRLGGIDIDGVLRGKYVSIEKFESALRGGLGFCDVIFGWASG